MRKEYLIFGIILAVLLVAYALTRNWVSSGREKARMTETGQTVKKSMEQLRQEFNKKFASLEKMVDVRLDSLERHYREDVLPTETLTVATGNPDSDSLIAAAEKTFHPGDSVILVDTTSSPPETVAVELGATADTAKNAVASDAPSEVEVKIYNRYLKKRWSLPGDLTSYELKVAKAEIYDELADAYGVSAAEARAIVDKVYGYRKRGKQ